MKKFFEVLITNGAMEIIRKTYNGELDNITKGEFEDIIRELRGDDIQVEGNDNAIWIADDIEEICKLIDDSYNSKSFYKVEELGIYLSEDDTVGDLFYAGHIGEVDQFMEFFLGDNEEEFSKNLQDITWYDEENELYEAVQNKLATIEDNDEIDDDKEEIELKVSNRFSCDIKEALEDSEEYKDVEYEEVGYFAGEKIYRINDKLYYLTDDSYRVNTEHYFKLREVSEKCYLHFNYK